MTKTHYDGEALRQETCSRAWAIWGWRGTAAPRPRRRAVRSGPRKPRAPSAGGGRWGNWVPSREAAAGRQLRTWSRAEEPRSGLAGLALGRIVLRLARPAVPGRRGLRALQPASPAHPSLSHGPHPSSIFLEDSFRAAPCVLWGLAPSTVQAMPAAGWTKAASAELRVAALTSPWPPPGPRLPLA